MPKGKATSSSGTSKKMRPALSPEAREKQLVALAVNLAEEQLRNGTASSQVITHYLKLGSTREKLEQELKMEEIKLQRAKTENLKSQERNEQLMREAMEAFKTYSGRGGHDDD